MTGIALSRNPDFWDGLGAFGNAPALVDERSGMIWSYRQLQDDVAAARKKLELGGGKLIFLFAGNDAGAVICYLAALAAGVPIYLGNPKSTWSETSGLLDAYAPDILLWKGYPEGLPPQYRMKEPLFGYHVAERCGARAPVGAGVALLLSTSGSLAVPKMVRLSGASVSAAASQVAEALRLEPSHRAITSLPMNFVYGLSVIQSHLSVGASLVMTQRSIQDPSFWRLLGETGTTSLAGVPWTYGTLRMLSFDPARHPSLRNFSLSGGAMAADLFAWLIAMEEQVKLYAMYGQTEAGGRMTVLPPEMLARKRGSAGLPVKGARVDCDRDGNITFHGPNVMLGYARNRGEITGQDDQTGTLATGDTGFLDADGCLYLTGRTSRITKLFGVRVDLGEVEAVLGNPPGLALTCGGETLDIYVEEKPSLALEKKLAGLAKQLRVPDHCIAVHFVSALPRNEYGKIRYGELDGLPSNI